MGTRKNDDGDIDIIDIDPYENLDYNSGMESAREKLRRDNELYGDGSSAWGGSSQEDDLDDEYSRRKEEGYDDGDECDDEDLGLDDDD